MLWLRYTSYAGATFTVLFYTALIIFTLALTAPDPKESWQQASQRPGHNAVLKATVGIACVGLALDIFILLLPIAGVSRLQLSRKRKIGVMAVFLTGAMCVNNFLCSLFFHKANVDYRACIASSLAIYYKWKLDYQNSADVTYETMPVLLTG